MKKLILTIMSVCMVLFIHAQTDSQNRSQVGTLFGTDSFVGWYAGMSLGVSQLNQEPALIPGLEGGVIIDRKLAMGLKFLGFTGDLYEVSNSHTIMGQEVFLEGGYGGINVEPMILGNSPIHITLPMLFGIGGASYTTVEEFPEMDEDGEWDTERKLLESDVFWVFEPGLTLEIYLTRFMKMSAGVNYRLVSPLDMTDTPTNAFNGYSGTVSLKFGRF